MKYIKKFETHSDYEDYLESQDYLTPNVSYCVDMNEVHFEKYDPNIYYDFAMKSVSEEYDYEEVLAQNEVPEGGVWTWEWFDEMWQQDEQRFQKLFDGETVYFGNGFTELPDEIWIDYDGPSSVVFGSNTLSSIGCIARGTGSVDYISFVGANPYYDSRENCNCLIETATNKIIMGSNNAFIPSSVTEIGSNAFTKYGNITEIPNGVITIGEYSFGQCLGFTNITIPNSVTTIGNGAFDSCENATSLSIGSGVSSIGKWAFDYCIGLTSITVDGSNTTYKSENNCIINKNTGELLKGCNGTVLPLPSGITIIGDNAFSECDEISGSLVVPGTVTEIGRYAFFNCTNITSITLTEGLTRILDGAFRNTGISGDFTIPSTVTYLGQEFVAETGITSLTCLPTTPPQFGALSALYGNFTIYVPSASLDTYKTNNQWKYFASRIQAIPT